MPYQCHATEGINLRNCVATCVKQKKHLNCALSGMGAAPMSKSRYPAININTSRGRPTALSFSPQKMEFLSFILFALLWQACECNSFSQHWVFNKTTANRLVATLNAFRAMVRPEASQMRFLVCCFLSIKKVPLFFYK